MTKNTGKMLANKIRDNKIVTERIYDILQTYDSLAVLIGSKCIGTDLKWYKKE